MKAVEAYNLIYNTTVEHNITTKLYFAVKPRTTLYQFLFAVHNSIYHICTSITLRILRQLCYVYKMLGNSFVQLCAP